MLNYFDLLSSNIPDVTIGRASCKLALVHDRSLESMEVTMSAAFHFLEVLVISVAALVALTLVLLVIVAHLPGGPLKEILAALAKRIGATAAISLLAVPLEPFPESMCSIRRGDGVPRDLLVRHLQGHRRHVQIARDRAIARRARTWRHRYFSAMPRMTARPHARSAMH